MLTSIYLDTFHAESVTSVQHGNFARLLSRVYGERAALKVIKSNLF